jgi:hypothetical protein
VSPVSYWDPQHHGALFVPLECVLALVLLARLWRRGASGTARAAMALLALAYGVGLAAGVARLLLGGSAGSLQGVITGRS